jgi:molybdate transport system ATP-binding protein
MNGLDAHLVAHRGGFDLDVSLRIEPGRTAALLGPNGAGKSTTVDCLTGLLALDAGHITLDGRVLDHPTANVFVPTERRRLGVAYQDHRLFDHLDVVDNITFGRRVGGDRRRAARLTAGPWIEAFELQGLEHRRPDELSGGQAQRVAIARALASEPDLVLLDEPLSALDVEARTKLRRELADQLGQHRAPRLLITHDPGEAFLLADEIHVMEDGRITQRGAADDIRRRPATPYVAALAGTNFLTGANQGGELLLDDHARTLRTADTHTIGPVLITVAPRAISLHRDEPDGSARNAWPTTVAAVEPMGETTRIELGDPLPLTVEITPAATQDLGLEPGSAIWAAVKATEVNVTPA